MLTISLFGVPCVCKGYICTLLQKEYGERAQIVGTGQLIRDELENPKFRKQHESAIKHRQNLADEVIFQLVKKKLATITDPSAIVVLEGFITVKQLEWLADNGLLSRNTSATILFTASPEICYGRAMHRFENSKKKRLDDARLKENFEIGQERFLSAWPSLKHFLHNKGIWLQSIDANGDIEKTVFPEVQNVFSAVTAFPPPKSAPKVTDSRRRYQAPRPSMMQFAAA